VINSNRWNRLRYSIYAPFYNIAVRVLNRGRRRSIELVDIQPDEHVLVVGCGTGLDFDYLPAEVRVTAGDITPAMVRRAAERAERLGLDADIRVLDAHRLDIQDESVDVVLLHLILAVVPDPYAAIAEAARVLKPDGRIGIFDKFIAHEKRPGIFRRALNTLIRIAATDINRSVEPMLDHAGLSLIHDEPAYGGGFFRVLKAVKSEIRTRGTGANSILS
jgi:phosphatidylethanolamine/phosphatidyl-N-methylethanolamine N-methyltransferase